MITVEGDMVRLQRLRAQVEAEAAAVPEPPPLLAAGHQRLARLQQRHARASNVLEQFRLEQEMEALHQSLTATVRDFEQRCRAHRLATQHARDHLRRASAETYERTHAQTMARIRTQLTAALEAVDLLEGQRLHLEHEYMLRGANAFTNQRLAGLIRDARRIAETAPATSRTSA